MFAQANSEHCRHKIFNADWIIDGEPQSQSLFAMIRDTHAAHPHGTLVAYADNSSVIEGAHVARFYPGEDGRYAAHRETTHMLMKVETHNHPTAIAPFPGAATGAGGEIRDEGATGTRRKAEGRARRLSRRRTCASRRCRSHGKRTTTASPIASPRRCRSCMEGPIGAASFNNEFGRPNLTGYFRTFEHAGRRRNARLPQADHARRRRGQYRARRTRTRSRSPRHAADPARRSRDADRHGRRRRVVDGHRRQHRRSRFRFGAARQCRDGASRAGGHRPLLAAAATRIRSCRSTTSARADCRTRCRS